MHYDSCKVTGVQTSSEPDVNEAKSGGEKFQVVLDAGNAEIFDTDISEKPSCGSKEGSLQSRDINEKNVTTAKSGSKPLCITSNEKNSQTLRGDSEKQHDVGALVEIINPVNKRKLNEEDGNKLLSTTNNAVEDTNSERNSLADTAATGAVLCTDAKKALTGKGKKMTEESEGSDQFDAEDGINDTSSANLHYIGVDDEGEGEEEEGSLRHKPIDEGVGGKGEGEVGGLEVGSSVDDNKYSKKAYSETGSSEGNSDSTRSVDQHVNSNAHKAAEPTSPTSRYVRLDFVSSMRDKGVVH